MLRRTKADQVKPVYETFILRFPDLVTLDKASQKEIEQIVYPLGLNWRTPVFKQVAHVLGQLHNYSIPNDRTSLISLPGIGDYVAGAVLSVAFRLPEWIVDTNVARVFKRYYGITTIHEARRDKQIVSLAQQYANHQSAREANLGILDFAALICTALKPRCRECLLQSGCHYYDSENN
jgi:A/G-specific adenine glycosylase